MNSMIILEGREVYYNEILQKVPQSTNEIQSYLNEAKGMPADMDDKIRENEVIEGFSV